MGGAGGGAHTVASACMNLKQYVAQVNHELRLDTPTIPLLTNFFCAVFQITAISAMGRAVRVEWEYTYPEDLVRFIVVLDYEGPCPITPLGYNIKTSFDPSTRRVSIDIREYSDYNLRIRAQPTSLPIREVSERVHTSGTILSMHSVLRMQIDLCYHSL